jgi:hypothetical protein
VIAETTGLDNVITAPNDGWLWRPAQAIDFHEYLRKKMPTKVSAYKKKSRAVRALRLAQCKTAQQWAKVSVEDAIVRGLAIPLAVVNTKARFFKLADEWSEKTMHVSSVSDLINDPSYQQIIGLGWDALPYLLDDLRRNKRFWFPALAAIAGVRPFDPGDLSNPRRMTEAWLKWGRRKGLID